MDLSMIILISLIAAPILYFLAKFSHKIAYILFSFIQVFLFVFILLQKGIINTVSSFEIMDGLKLNFGFTPINWYFGSIIMLIISMSAIFMISIKKKSPAKLLLLSLVSTGAIGATLSMDFLTLVIFWELSTWSSLILIVLDKEKSFREAIKYVSVSAIGTYSMLYAVFYILKSFGTVNYLEVADKMKVAPESSKILIFVLFGIMALAKAGSFPLHIWLRGSHSTAPDEFSPILSGALTKIGAYLLFIMVAVIPSSSIFSWLPSIGGITLVNYVLAWLGGISIVVGTVMAIRMEDVKELIAFSTVSNSGYIVLAMALGGTYGTIGGLMHVLNHALASAAMFMSMAAVIHRTGTTKMREMGGLITKMPITFAAYLVAIISVAGIPPMSGFASKWLIYQQLVKNGLPFLAFAAFFGSVGSFMYVFKPLTGVFLGQLKPEHKNVKEAPFTMILPMSILTLLTIFWGILPSNAISFINKIVHYTGGKEIQLTFSRIIALTGQWDSVLVTMAFFVGFIIAFIIFLMGKKARQVDLMDTYTGGEFLYTAELYHFVYKMYRPFDRMFEKWPSMENWLTSLSYKIKELGALLKTLFYPKYPQGYVAVSMLTLLVAFWWLR
ncbi:MAG: NADH-quinone oxidoreductase subunit M [Thermotogae bacterium]|uniref:proton-conducting transporter transmembrane domain-containing protein n=1 Tax=Kosmotoga sp. TaxID=1955248 RepID=UPI000F1E836B|nr:proton-conducting transporter membrane subunit [Kosmotoga sp.]MBO8166312.1 NADH-quinone oxidoreductase subunit M [Kosmotoga sp.]RKX48887.1 MAG: NADH-quinone oxidoreductase subunit M [Thermotogota bacterium]